MRCILAEATPGLASCEKVFRSFGNRASKPARTIENL